MLEDFLNKQVELIKSNVEADIVAARKKSEADISAVKYIGGLVEKFKNKYSNPELEKEIYFDLKDLMDKIYQTYDYEEEVLLDNAENHRKREEMEKGVALGLEKISGDPRVLDGAFDIGEVLSLTEKGKKILDGYRLAIGKLPLKDYRKKLHKELCDLSRDY